MWQPIAGVAALVVLGIFGFLFPSLWPIPTAAGALLVVGALASKPKPQLLLPSGDLMNEQNDMQMPEVWNEGEISLGIERYRSNGNMLGRYVDGVVSRFVMGQDMRTMEVRSKFLETFNKHAEIARQSYKWHRYMKGGRAALEEDAEDLQAQVKLQKAKNELAGVKGDPELEELQKKAKRVELLLQIAQYEKSIADLNRPAPPPPPAAPSSSEVRQQQTKELDAREKRVREAMRITQADPTLSEEQKQRKLNALEEQLAEIHEEQAKLL
jgi:hypothetical protein